jgi:pyruvate,water dikinase
MKSATNTPTTPLLDAFTYLTAEALKYSVISSPRSIPTVQYEEMYIRPFENISMHDLQSVGGKNASLGEMIQNLPNVNIPSGYAVTSEGYRHFLRHNNLEERIAKELNKIVVQDQEHKKGLENVGEAIRNMILDGDMPADLREQIATAYRAMERRYQHQNLDIAVRSRFVFS